MKKTKKVIFIISLLTIRFASAQNTYVYPSANDPQANEKAHLFILSGQSNMARFKPETTFTPNIVKAFGEGNVLIVKDAMGGQSIQRWYKDWKSVQGAPGKENGDLYDRLITKVKSSIKGKKILSVSFIWMQGEKDAVINQTGVYKKSFFGLLKQLEQDLGRTDLNVVIGRLSDYSLHPGKNYGKHKEWQQMRELQVSMAEELPSAAWVNCDDLNNKTDKKANAIFNDVHYTHDGYDLLGERYAEKVTALVKGK